MHACCSQIITACTNQITNFYVSLFSRDREYERRLELQFKPLSNMLKSTQTVHCVSKLVVLLLKSVTVQVSLADSMHKASR